MTDSMIISALQLSAVAKNSVVYGQIGSGYLICNATEANVKNRYRTAGTFSKLWVALLSNSVSANSTIVTRKNGTTNGNLTVTVGSNQSGIFEDLVNSDSVTVGDDWNFSLTTGNSGTQFGQFNISVVFSPTDTTLTLSKLTFFSDLVSLNAASSAFDTIIRGSTSPEANIKMRIRNAYTAQNLYVNMLTNTRTTNTTVGVRKNGGAGTCIVTYGSGISGVLEDTTHSDSFAAGDDYNIAGITGTGSGALTTTTSSVELISTINKFIVVDSFPATSTSFNSSWFYALCGGFGNTATSNPASVIEQVTSRFLVHYRDMDILVITNTIATSTSFFYFRKNGVDDVLQVSVAAGATGLFEDLTHDESCKNDGTDRLSFHVTTPNTSGIIVTPYIKAEGYVTTVVPKTFTVDAILKATKTKTFTIDAILKATTPKTFTIDAILKATKIKTFTLDALIQKQNLSKTFTIDSILRATLSKLFKIDAILKATKTKTFTIDAIIVNRRSKIFLIDSILKAKFSKLFSLDAIVYHKDESIYPIPIYMTYQGRFTLKTISLSGMLS